MNWVKGRARPVRATLKRLRGNLPGGGIVLFGLDGGFV